MEETLDREIKKCSHFKDELSALFFNMDNFKKVNDKYGHEVTGIALREVCEVMQKNVRCSNIICRYGGDETVIISSIVIWHLWQCDCISTKRLWQLINPAIRQRWEFYKLVIGCCRR